MSLMLLLPFHRLLFLPLLLLLHFTLYSSCLRIDKCCPPGNILILNDTGNFACECAGKQSQLLLDPREEISKGLPACNDYSYLVAMLLEDAEGKIPDNACLEIFSDEESHQDFPVITYCFSVTDTVIESRFSEEVEEPRAPEILNFRKCCTENWAYDIDKKFCTHSGSADLKMLFDRFHGVDFVDVYNGPPTCEHALVDYKIEFTHVYSLGDSVNISIPWDGEKRNVTIEMDNGCLDVEASGKFIAARVCSSADYCSRNACIRKCCPENKINYNCLDSPQNVSMENFRTSLASTAANSSSLPILDIQSYGLIVGRPCDLYYTGDEYWEIGNFGELLVSDSPKYTHDNSCIELIYNDPNFENGLYPFYCFDDAATVPAGQYVSHARDDITAGLTLTSCCFLLATLLVYMCLPSLQNLHGKTLMCHVVSLFFAYACVAIVEIITYGLLGEINDHTGDVICKCLGFTMLFCFHSTFFWLNVMCFDIWWTFRGMQPRVRATTARKKRHQRNRFLTYCLYAWGLAFLLSALSALLEYLGLLNSWIGRERCWFGNKSIEEIIFFIVPVTITLLVNVIFFIVTSYRCSKVKTEIKRVMANVKDPTTRKFHSNKTRLLMNLKLFIVMGMPWILENIQGYIKHYHELPLWMDELLFLADVVNSLQGLWIFILFVLKPKVYRELRKRFSIGRVSRTTNTLGLEPIPRSASNATFVSNFIANSTAT